MLIFSGDAGDDGQWWFLCRWRLIITWPTCGRLTSSVASGALESGQLSHGQSAAHDHHIMSAAARPHFPAPRLTNMHAVGERATTWVNANYRHPHATRHAPHVIKLEFHRAILCIASPWHPRELRMSATSRVCRAWRLPHLAWRALPWLVGRRSTAV